MLPQEIQYLRCLIQSWINVHVQILEKDFLIVSPAQLCKSRNSTASFHTTKKLEKQKKSKSGSDSYICEKDNREISIISKRTDTTPCDKIENCSEVHSLHKQKISVKTYFKDLPGTTRIT